MFYQNINKLINDEASKLLVEKTLSIKTDYSNEKATYYCLNYKLNKYE
jgi:hypothetical protein